MAQTAPTVVVTGASGFVASEVVKQLLEKVSKIPALLNCAHMNGGSEHAAAKAVWEIVVDQFGSEFGVVMI